MDLVKRYPNYPPLAKATQLAIRFPRRWQGRVSGHSYAGEDAPSFRRSHVRGSSRHGGEAVSYAYAMHTAEVSAASRSEPPIRMLNVLIASPGDAKAARKVIERALYEWNTQRTDATRVVLRPRLWESGSVPILGKGDGQSVINSQLVDSADIIFAVFYHRLGSPTPRAVSGTAEEITRAMKANKPVHLYFAQKNIPHTADIDDFKALKDFRAKMQGKGLVATFKSETELSIAIPRAIEHDLRILAAERT